MPDTENVNYGISAWYASLADYTFPTIFVKLKESDLELIACGEKETNETEAIILRIERAQSAFYGATFVLTDTAAPTDTPRFINKKGAVHSAKSAWNNLVSSEKIRRAARHKEFEFICVRPFRNMNYPREFRLFIYNGSLKLMSQVKLDRSYKRLTLKGEFWWNKAKEFVENISWLLPHRTVVMDLYFTSKNEIIIIDFNKWGKPTDPMLAKNWNLDWRREHGIKLL